MELYMDNPQGTNNKNLIIKNNINDLKWLGGFFDGKGSISFSSGCPRLTIVNTNPIAISKCRTIFVKNDIDAKISERSKPSKSSKKKRWDIYCKAEDTHKSILLLENYIYGKKKQVELIKDYFNNQNKNAEIYHQKMQYLNQTNNIIIIDDEILKLKLEFEFEKDYLNNENNNSRIEKNNFNDLYYLCGILDAEGTFQISQRSNHHCKTDRFTPTISLVNTNKEIITRCYSTLLNLGIGCHISTRDNMKRNRVRWDLLVSGVKRCNDLSNLLKDKLIVKRSQNELLNLYCYHRLDNPKSINEMGYEYKMAIQKLNSES